MNGHEVINGQQFQYIYNLYLLLIVVVISIALVYQTMADSQLQQPDLYCLNRLDSIEYIPVKDMYFITSGGYYWFIAAKSFPPKGPTGKLPEPFKRGDAAIFLDKQTVCQNNARAPKVAKSLTEQVVLVMERREDGSRQVHTFDTKTSKWSDQPKNFNTNDILKKIKIDSKSIVKDMFGIRMSQIYVMLDNRYAGIEWKDVCLADGQVNGYQQQDRGTINLPFSVTVDAVTVVNMNQLHIFHGQQFRTIDIVDTQADEGVLGQSSSSGDSPLRQFFKFGDNKTETDCSSRPTGGVGGVGDNNNDDNNGNPNQLKSSGDSNTATKKGDGGGGISGLTIALVGVGVLIILIVMAASLTFFLSRKKSSTASSGDGDGGHAPSAKGSASVGGHDLPAKVAVGAGHSHPAKGSGGVGHTHKAKGAASGGHVHPVKGKQPPPPRPLKSSTVAPKVKAKAAHKK